MKIVEDKLYLNSGLRSKAFESLFKTDLYAPISLWLQFYSSIAVVNW